MRELDIDRDEVLREVLDIEFDGIERRAIELSESFARQEQELAKLRAWIRGLKEGKDYDK